MNIQPVKRFLLGTALLVFGLILPPLGAEDFTFDSLGGEFEDTASACSLEIHGDLYNGLRTGIGAAAQDDWFSREDRADTAEYTGKAGLDLSFSADSFDLFLNLNLDPRKLEDSPEALLDEAYFRYYGSGYSLETGLMKVVWGKGDQVHVVDLLNSNDLTDYLNPDYLERRTAVPMIKLNLPAGVIGSLEAVFIPVLTPDTIPMSGTWSPRAAADLTALGQKHVQYLAAQAYASTLAATTSEAAAVMAEAAILQQYGDAGAFLPETGSLDYSQAALHYTGSLGGLDFGLTGYWGFIKTPSAAYTADGSGNITSFSLSYDRLYALGLEAGGVLAGFNLRGEAAVYLTDDLKGDDPLVHNGSFNYVAGFDRDLGIHNLNLSFQCLGERLFQGDAASDPLDVDYSSNGDIGSHRLIARVSDSFNHEKLLIEVKGICSIEEADWMLAPKITCKPEADLQFSARAGLYGGDEEGNLGQFKDSSFLELEATLYF